MNQDINPANRHRVDRTQDEANAAEYDACCCRVGRSTPTGAG